MNAIAYVLAFVLIALSQPLFAQGLDQCEGFFFRTKKSACLNILARGELNTRALPICEQLNVEDRVRSDFSLSEFQEISAELLFIDEQRIECLDAIVNKNFDSAALEKCSALVPFDRSDYISIARPVRCLENYGHSVKSPLSYRDLELRLKEIESVVLQAESYLRLRNAQVVDQLLKKIKSLSELQ